MQCMCYHHVIFDWVKDAFKLALMITYDIVLKQTRNVHTLISRIHSLLVLIQVNC